MHLEITYPVQVVYGFRPLADKSAFRTHQYHFSIVPRHTDQESFLRRSFSFSRYAPVVVSELIGCGPWLTRRSRSFRRASEYHSLLKSGHCTLEATPAFQCRPQEGAKLESAYISFIFILWCHESAYTNGTAMAVPADNNTSIHPQLNQQYYHGASGYLGLCEEAQVSSIPNGQEVDRVYTRCALGM
jgi:hypothetical protein